jgi:hypothetical protein
VDVIVADDRAAREDRPALAPWLDPGGAGAALPTLWRGTVREGGTRRRVVLLDARATRGAAAEGTAPGAGGGADAAGAGPPQRAGTSR